eukprot:jgi/Mesen1/6028/ME000308S05219
MLKHLTKVRIQFNPLDGRSASALEFLAQCNSRKAKESNTKCDVTVKRTTDKSPPFVKVTFQNGIEATMDGATMPAQVMRKRILEQAEMMETEQLFKDANLKWPVTITDGACH